MTQPPFTSHRTVPGSSGALALITIALTALIAGCKPSGPASTRTTSAAISSLPERVAFVERYVAFRRTYETLDFDVYYQNNNGGMVPAPSDSDVRLVATVPPAELAAWVPAGVPKIAAPADRSWLTSVPASLNLTGLNEWYDDGRQAVGIDRARRIVAYRSLRI